MQYLPLPKALGIHHKAVWLSHLSGCFFCLFPFRLLFRRQDTGLFQGSLPGPLRPPQPSLSDFICSQDLTPTRWSSHNPAGSAVSPGPPV